MKSLYTSVISMIVLSCCSGLCVAGEHLYVVQYNGESLGRIDLTSGFVNNQVLELGYGCNEIVVLGTRLYITNSFINTVQEIDAENQITLRDLPMTGGNNPYSLTALNNDTLAVTHFLSNNILLLRLSDGQIIGNIPVGSGPEGILAFEDRFYVCVTGYSPQGYAPGKVLVYNRYSMALLDSLSVGINPQFAAIDSQNRLHVVCTGNYVDVAGQVYIFNLNTHNNPAILSVGGTPSTISFSEEFAFLAAGGWGGSGKIYRYRLSDLAILNSDINPITTELGAYDAVAVSDGTFYVSCAERDVVEHRTADGSLISTFLVGDGPGFMTYYETPSNTPIVQDWIPSESKMEAFPNPFNSVVFLRFEQSQKVQSNIKIYNNIGQQVDELKTDFGNSVLAWNPSLSSINHLSTGTYFAVLAGSNDLKPLRLVYIK